MPLLLLLNLHLDLLNLLLGIHDLFLPSVSLSLALLVPHDLLPDLLVLLGQVLDLLFLLLQVGLKFLVVSHLSLILSDLHALLDLPVFGFDF